ncbi:MAG: transposase [Acidobacteriota bacterium]
MSRSLRFLHRPGAVVEITQRTLQGRYLLRPSEPLKALVIGCLSRAQKKNPGARLYAVAVMSNHFHLLAGFDTALVMASFMGHLKTNLSKEIGRAHDWPGALWDNRYRAVPVSDEPAAQIARLRYVLSQGVKEGLVMSPYDWPGVHSAQALTTGEPLRGEWVDRTRLYRARQRDPEAREADFTSDENVRLEALPALLSDSFQNFRAEVARWVAEIERESRGGADASGGRAGRPGCLRSILRRDPHHRPKRMASSPQPRLHAATRRVREMLSRGYREFEIAYRAAAEKLAAGDRGALFPDNCFPPRLPFSPPPPGALDSS